MRPRNRFEGTCFSCERKGRRAEDYRSAKKMEKTRNAPAVKKVEIVRGSATSVGVKSILRINTKACAEAWKTGLAIVRRVELRRVRYWPNKCASEC